MIVMTIPSNVLLVLLDGVGTSSTPFDGSDVVETGFDDDIVLLSSDGDDVLVTFGEGDIFVSFGDGDVLVTFGGGDILVSFGEGDVLVTFGGGNILVSLGEGDVLVTFGGANVLLLNSGVGVGEIVLDLLWLSLIHKEWICSSKTAVTFLIRSSIRSFKSRASKSSTLLLKFITFCSRSFILTFKLFVVSL